MIFILLLLLFLTCCVSGTFVVNVTQASYQAEENQNITLEWTFSTRTSLKSVYIVCEMFTETRISVLFHLHQGVESPESQDPQFAGRVQWDKDVLTEGRLTLHVSRLRTSDSGFYVCDILIKSEGRNSRRCWLNVTAAAEPRPLTQTVKPHQKIQGIIALYIGLGISAVALLALFVSLTLSFLRPVYTTGIEKA